jgi:hypothetical protein
MIYLIESGDFYKIGKSKNVEERLKSYRLHNPDTILIDTADVNDDLEKVAHDMLMDLKHDSEWFRKDQRVIDVFNHIKNGDYVNIERLLKYKEFEAKYKDAKYKYNNSVEFAERRAESAEARKEEAIDKYRKMVEKYNSLMDDYNNMSIKYQELAESYIELSQIYIKLRNEQ